ncbi:MAG: competence/damage-inducible protein A [Alphaproteobacteria bacterium]|nr:MAG: competence/damage-inducible protein A [Alphaproteobacteria bacterium]
MPNPTAAMLVIGDEILSGRTRDSNLHHLAGRLTAHGIDLREARIVGDDHDAIVEAVRALSKAHDHVFTSGGIGPTHDDITADAVADAFGAAIDVREDARALLMAFFEARGVEATPERLRMARIPEGARLIENPVSAAPGFTLGNVHVMAGVPKVFEAMLDSLLETIAGGRPRLSQTFRVERPEGEIAAPLADLAARYPELSIGSYPFHDNGVYGANIVVRGFDGAQVNAAMVELGRLFPEAKA